MTRRMSSTKSLAAGTLLALAGVGVAACDNADDAQDGQFNCGIEVDGVERAVDCDQVNDNDGTAYYGGGIYPVFIHSYPASGTTYAPGQRLPVDAKRSRIGYKDSASRQRFGLPPSGRIPNNTVKTGVLGKGGGPAAGKAGGGGKSVGGVGGRSGSGGG